MGREPSAASLSPENTVLLELFRIHGIAAVPTDDRIIFPQHNMSAHAAVTTASQEHAGTLLQLTVRVEIEPGRAIVESFAGVGESVDKALSDARRTFASTTFHVILASFFDSDDKQSSGQTTVEEWTIGGQRRRVIIGNIGMRGQLPIQGAQAFAWVQRFNDALGTAQLSSGTHWVRLFYSQMQHKVVACELLLDNAPWDEIQSQVASIEWPLGEAFYSVRLFMVIQDQKPAVRR